MKKVKILLASSEDLRDEALELADLIEHLNLILEPQDIHIYLEKWEYLGSSSYGKGQTEGEGNRYDATLEDCEICMVVFGKKFGSYTEKELRNTYERARKEGVNPSKLYVYFKKLDDLTEDLKRFRDSYAEVYSCSPDLFTDINSLKNDFLLKFQLFQNKYLQNSSPVEIKDGKVTIYDKDLFINFHDLPFVNKVTRLNGIKDSIENIDLLLSVLSDEEPQYSESAEERRKLEEEKAKLETTLWETALRISEFKEHKLSDKLERAIELFEKGEIERLLEIIDSEGLKAEAQTNIEKINEGKREVVEGYKLFTEANRKIEQATEALKNNIREFQLAIQAEELNMKSGWVERIDKNYDLIIYYSKYIFETNSLEYLKTINEIGEGFRKIGKYDKAYKLHKESFNQIKKSNLDSYLYCHILRNLSWDCVRKSKYKQALKFALLSNSKLKRTNEVSKTDKANIYNTISVCYKFLKEGEKALKYGKKSYKIKLKHLGFYNKETARICSNLGVIFRDLRDYKNSIVYFNKALKIYEHILKRVDPDLAGLHGNLGCTWEDLKLYDKALESHFNALKIAYKIYGKVSVFAIVHLNNISKVYGKIGNFDNELVFLRKVLSLKKRIYGNVHLEIAKSYYLIGKFYFRVNNYDNAFKFFNKSCKMAKLLNLNTLLGYNCSKLGIILNLQGKLGDAKEKFEEALKLLPEDHPEAIDTRRRLEELETNNLKEGE